MSPEDPIRLFNDLFARAKEVCQTDPTVMALSTAGADGRPTVRYVLLKDADERGFTFYTNLDSPKSRQLREQPYAALAFYWMPLDRQVRIDGRVVPVSDEEADVYFATRPRESQIGAWASRQSEALATQEELDARVSEVGRRFADAPVPRPPHWSGFRVVPDRIEFWRSRPGRLHERVIYERRDTGWTKGWLYP